MGVSLAAQDLRDRLTSAYKSDLVTGDFLYDFAEVLDESLYAEWQQALDDARTYLFRKTGPGAYLDRWLEFFEQPRNDPAETDATARLRLAAIYVTRWGGPSVDDLVSLLAVSLGIGLSVPIYTENVDPATGLFEPARMDFTLPGTAFPVGSNVTTLAARMETALNQAASGGVRVYLRVSGGATYNGPYVYDGTTSIYGA